MKEYQRYIKLLPIAAILFTSCVQRNTESGDKARADYASTLNDSIESLKQEIDSCNAKADILRSEVGEELKAFTGVSNAREAAPYYILTSHKNRYPLSSTGVIARINDSSQFELIAALSGKAFEKIKVEANGNTLTSQVVPNDQALNYRTDALTTVTFTGAATDSIGQFISDNSESAIKLIYIQSHDVQTYNIPTDNAQMIAATYKLYSTQRELNRLERRVPMLNEKINLLRLHLEKK